MRTRRMKGGETVADDGGARGKRRCGQGAARARRQSERARATGSDRAHVGRGRGHAAVVRALIDGGADVRARLESGFTPLFFAVREGHIEVTRALLKAGANVNEALQA